MTSTYYCSACKRTFSSIESYQNHSCSTATLGGASDLRKARNESGSTEGGTGSN